jgi:hypothetical protein
MTHRRQFSLGSLMLLFLLTGVIAGLPRASAIVGVVFLVMTGAAVLRTVRVVSKSRDVGRRTTFSASLGTFLGSLCVVSSLLCLSAVTLAVVALIGGLHLGMKVARVVRAATTYLKLPTAAQLLVRGSSLVAACLFAADRRLLHRFWPTGICGIESR